MMMAPHKILQQQGSNSIPLQSLLRSFAFAEDYPVQGQSLIIS